jgi:hypothetical protein
MSRSKVDFEQHLITCILCKKEVGTKQDLANHTTLDHSKTLDVYVRCNTTNFTLRFIV